MSESVESVIADMRRSAGERPDTPYFAAVSDWANRLERAAAPQPKDARPSPEGVGEEGRQLLPSGWRVSVQRGLPGVLYLSIEGPGCSTCDQASPFGDVKRRIYERFEQALATQQEQDSREGQDGERGEATGDTTTFADAWAKLRPIDRTVISAYFNEPSRTPHPAAHVEGGARDRDGLPPHIKSGAEFLSERLKSAPTPQEQDSREGHEPMVDWWLKACDWPVDKGFTWQDMPDEHDPCYVYMPCGGGLEFCHHAKNGVDQARAQFVTAACNAYLSSHHPAAHVEGGARVDADGKPGPKGHIPWSKEVG